MADFARRSVAIAKAGIYDLELHHDEVVLPVLRFWRVFERDDLGHAGEQAREELAGFVDGLARRARRFAERRAAAAAQD
jgi:acyl-[acyl-carrier-protein] desaturase